ALELRELQRRRHIREHGVARQERLFQWRSIPWVQVRADLRATGLQLLQRRHGPVAKRDLIGREVRRPHAQRPQQRVEARQLTDIVDRHAVAAGSPIVLLRVDRDYHEDGPGHVRYPHGRAGARSRARTRAARSTLRSHCPRQLGRKATSSWVTPSDAVHWRLYASSPRRKSKRW